jgi:EmrB/QacA subfamily drug resistance transporter
MSENVYNKAIIPWIVAIALFMETLDITIITTAIPAMALSLRVDPINLKLALTSYLLSIALFIPISGWVADKLGTQRTFILALLIFTVSSMMCGRAGSLSELVIGRIFQGVGGAFMMPVGRLILLRTFTKSELIRALNFVAVPALLGPLLGPFLGGFITTYYSWPWIFYVNVPMGLIGIVTTFCCIKNYKVVPLRRFDMMGFLRFGSSLAAIAFAIEAISVPSIQRSLIVWVTVFALLGFLLFYRHYKKTRQPVLDLKLFSIRTFWVAAIGNVWMRIGISSVMFLLPLLLQIGYGLSPLRSGLLTGLGTLGMLFSKSINKLILHRLGFRKMLCLTSVLTGMTILSFSLIGSINIPLIVGLVFINGLVTSLQYTGMNVLYYVDLDLDDMSDATSITGTLQQLSVGLGITVSTLVLQFFAGWNHTLAFNNPLPFLHAFLVMGAIALSSVLIFLKLKPRDGQQVG